MHPAFKQKYAANPISKKRKQKNNYISLNNMDAGKISKFMVFLGPKTKIPMRLLKQWLNL